MKPIVPPPLIGLMFAGLIWLNHRLLPTASFDFVAREALAVVCLVIGVVIDVSALLAFRRAQTTINPLVPQKASTIVDNGPFRFSRNPMYLGMAFILLGWTVWLGNPVGLLWVLAFGVTVTQLQIKPEESALAEKFGQPYQDYLRRVRRWL